MNVFDAFGASSSGLGTGGPAVSGGPFQSGPFTFGKTPNSPWLFIGVIVLTAGITYYVVK